MVGEFGSAREFSLKYSEQANTAAQQRLMDDLVASGVAAIMVSAVDPKTETEALNTVAFGWSRS